MSADIIGHIKNIADELVSTNSVMTRADLAYELSKFGIEGDTLKVSVLIWETYCKYNYNENIKKVFLNNSKTGSVVEEYEMHILLNKGNEEQFFSKMSPILDDSREALRKLDEKLNNSLSGQKHTDFDLAKRVVGTKGLEQIRTKAQEVFKYYSLLVDSYQVAKEDVQNVVVAFSEIRQQVLDIYRKYSIALVDIFGERIKVIDPDLFDFDEIQWLEVAEMLKAAELQYNSIFNRSSQLIHEISDSFKKSIEQSVNTYRYTKNSTATLILAGLNMVGHYIDASDKTISLQQDLLIFERSAHKDTTAIKADMGRLFQIYKIINDIYIPASELFYKFSRDVLSAELQDLLELVYGGERITNLKRERDKLLEKCKNIELEQTDSQVSIGYYKEHITACNQLLQAMEDEYIYAKRCKPSKPFFLINIFTLGYARKRYNRSIFEWNTTFSPVIKEYEELKVDVRIDDEELRNKTICYQRNKKRHNELISEIKKISDVIVKEISVDDDLKFKLLNHLNPIVQLLHLAKQIASSKLDTSLMSKVKIEDLKEELQFPVEIQNNLNSFTNILRENLVVDSKLTEQALKSNGVDISANDDEDGYMSNLQAVVDGQNEVLRKAVNLFERFTKLEEEKYRASTSFNHYEEEFKKIQEDFQQSMLQLDSKVEFLTDIMKKVKSSKDRDSIRGNLLLLLEGDSEILSERDIDDFLSGNKTITL